MAANNGINGDNITNNSKLKENSGKYTNNFDPNEISPLRTGQAKESVDSDNNSPQVQINLTQSSGTDDADTFVPNKKGTNKFKGTYEAVMTHFDISQKARVPFLIAIALCAVFLIVLITMIALWPRIPFYMKADVCVERECMKSSSQIFLYRKMVLKPFFDKENRHFLDYVYLRNVFSCGQYSERLELDSFGVTGGEWKMKAHADYEEISKTHAFIAQLPLDGSTYSAQSMLKGLHTTCMASEKLDKQLSDLELKKAIFSLRGWVYGENWQSNSWNFKEAMLTIHSRYGVFPFFKFSVENRNSPPFGNIVKISEGEYGLPHKMFYNLESDDKVIRAYKLLLRDFAINFGVVDNLARKFADEVFHFEKRIVNSLPEHREHVILPLIEVQKLAPSLPIIETMKSTFRKINDQTLILVEDAKLLSQLSIIVSTTDMNPLNNFLTWSLSRHFLPFMSREYRVALQGFYSDIYGTERSQPIWYFCSKLIRNWMPFAVDGLGQNPRLIVTASANPVNNNDNDRKSDLLVQGRANLNHELLRMIFYHLRHQLKRSIDENVSIDQEITNFINDKLSSMNLQIGVPAEILKDEDYLNKFYKDFYWSNVLFLENLEYHWSFKKKKMEAALESMNITDKTIANLYSIFGDDNDNRLIRYSIDLNTIIVSNRAVEKPFFHHKYPIAVNFARIGVELSKSLLEAVFLIGDQYKEDFYATHKLVNKTRSDFSLGDTSCLERLSDHKIPQTAKDRLVSDVTSGRFTAKCLKEFLRLIETSQPIPESQLPDAVTYELFNLRDRKRQPGLRPFDDMQLFSLVYMQRYCSVTNGYYKRFKAFVEMEIPGREGFNINWEQIALIKKSLDCSVTKKQCENIV